MEAKHRETSIRAWLAVVGATLALFCSIGFVNAFGVFQSYFKRTYLGDASEFKIGWISSVNVFFLFGLAPVGGILVDKFGPRVLVGMGCVGQLLAIFMISLCTEYYQFLLAQAVLLGMSMSFVTWPGVGVLGRHFPHKRGMAMGIVVGGSSLGGIIWPIMLDRMLLDVGGLDFSWTMRIIGFTMLPLLIIATASMNEPKNIGSPKESDSTAGMQAGNDNPISRQTRSSGTEAGSLETDEKKKHRTDISILRNKSFLLLCSGVATAYLGLFGPFFFVSSYASLHHYGSDSMAFYLISILNAASLFGRVLPGFVADKYGHFNVCALALFTSALTAFCWTAVHSLGGLIIFSMAYGFTSGAIMSLQGACAGKVATDRTQGTATGLLFGSLALTALFGTPICGQLSSQYGYLALSMFCGATLSTGGILVTLARLTIDRRLIAII